MRASLPDLGLTSINRSRDQKNITNQVGFWPLILLPIKTMAPGTEYTVADNQGGQP